MEDRLTQEEQQLLLELARGALGEVLSDQKISPLDESSLPPKLLKKGATFVTLTKQGMLRGCIGALLPTVALAQDVREHAVAAATQDYRFPPVTLSELPEISIEISRLTLPRALDYETPDQLIEQIRPGVDGVTIMDSYRRATFLPQVWEKLPEPPEFLNHLCNKMGARPDLWRHKKVGVQVYQVEKFQE